MHVDSVLNGRSSPGRTQAALPGCEGRIIPGSGEGLALLDDMIQIGEDGYGRRNHWVTNIMQLPPGDCKKATYAFLRGDTPLCPLAGGVRRLPAWNSFDGLPGILEAAFQRA